MKKIQASGVILAGIFIFSGLAGCSSNKTENLEVMGLKWGSSEQEMMKILDKEESAFEIEEGKRSSVYYLNGVEVFGEKTKRVQMEFLDFKNDGKQQLARVVLFYPENADMSKVLETMTKNYGTPLERMTVCVSGALSTDTEERYSSDHYKMWGEMPAGDYIEEKESEDYQQFFSTQTTYYEGISNETWEEFRNNQKLIRAYWADGVEEQYSGWKAVEFDASDFLFCETAKK